MIGEPRVTMFDLMMSLSVAMDLINTRLSNHHKQVAYIAHSISAALSQPFEIRKKIVLAGAAHDIGAFSVKERLAIKENKAAHIHQHAEFGYRLLRTMRALEDVGVMVRFHHTNWEHGEGDTMLGEKVPLESHILHVADEVANQLLPDFTILGQVSRIRERIKERKNTIFHPEVTDAFLFLSDQEYFWLDMTGSKIHEILKRKLDYEPLELDGLHELARLFSRIIDFRSPFTATHSTGLASVSSVIARLSGFSFRECQMMEIAGYLHDLGKLAVPAEILEKEGKLSKDDINILKAHSYYTYRILEQIEDLKVINTWASFHHERMDGKGYPFHIKGDDLSLGARILAVADVFTAITENRPYRAGLSKSETVRILMNMAENGGLDIGIVQKVQDHFEEINELRIIAQDESRRLHKEFFAGYQDK